MTQRDGVGVGFDLDHTIAIDNKLERVAFLRVLEMVLGAGGHALGNLSDEIDRIDALLVQQRSGSFSINEAVRRFVRERGVAAGDSYVEHFRAAALDRVDEFVIPLPGAKRTFEALRERGIRLAVLSNGWNPLQVKKARRAGFDGPVVASADIGVQKPAPGAFSALMAVLGTARENTWYVGDDPRADVAGARDAGLHAVWIDADNKTYPSELFPPPRAIRALEEIPSLLPAPSRIGS